MGVAPAVHQAGREAMTEALTRPMEDVEEPREARSAGSLLRATEVDTRLFGMLVALAVIWVGFHVLSGGTFLTARNLWNLSVQTSAVGIMATGMVLVIVTRNIDLSVGSVLAVVGMLMGLAQAEWLPELWGFDHPLTWVVTLVGGLVIGVLIGGFQGVLVAFGRIPSFIVTLGGLLVWRGVAWASASGRTIAPMDMSFQRIGGGARGSIGATWSWVVGIAACIGIIALLVNGRRQRRRYEFTLRPMWADVAIGVVSCGAVLAAVWVSNSYYLPENLARAYAEEHGITWPPEGLQISLGLPIPVLIPIGVALVMTFVATRLRFGRYVFAIGGNPEAANLAGVKSRATVVKTFALMGFLVGVAAAVSIARLNAAVSGLGTTAELYVIAAAVIGGTSLAGGIGTIAGAVLGALIMQSLQSGMVLLGVDAPLQDIVVGAVLVLAVGIDSYTRRNRR
jgi:D-xylose transport system permease protein